MVALIDLLQKEKKAISNIEMLTMSQQVSRVNIEVLRIIGVDPDDERLKETTTDLQRTEVELRANQIVLKAVRNEILAYFTSIKEET